MSFKIVNWKIYSIRHINLFTDTSLIDNNLCIQSFRAFCVVIRQNLANVLDKRGFVMIRVGTFTNAASVFQLNSYSLRLAKYPFKMAQST